MILQVLSSLPLVAGSDPLPSDPLTFAEPVRQEAPLVYGDRPGWYARLHFGLGSLADGDYDIVSGAATTEAEGSYDSGFLSGFAVGYRFDPRWSAELEYTYRTNDLSSVDLDGGGTFSDGGDYASVGILANGYYHFRPGERLRPYVGLGLGILQEIDSDLDDLGVEASETGLFAWQAMVGASYQLTGRLSLNVEGRYLGTAGPELDVGGGSSDVYEADYDHLGLLVGLTWSF